jgi:pyruvate,water dikinase
MEVGGVVSHGAIVAREYGIPAVAAVSDATTRLLTGQLVRVDGGAGVVTMVGADASLRPRPPGSAAPS